MKDITNLVEELKKVTGKLNIENDYRRFGINVFDMLSLAKKAQEISSNLVEAISHE